MKGIKLILFGIAVAVCSIAFTSNFYGIVGGCLGLAFAAVGLLKKD